MTSWHIRAVALPDGTSAQDRWLAPGGWRDSPVDGADTLPGRYALSGLVDAHSHLSFGRGSGGPVPLDAGGADASRARHAADGVAAIRDAGGDPAVVLTLPRRSPGRPLLVAAGRHLAPPGMYFEAVHLPVDGEHVVDVAVAELRAGATWAKLVADFPPAAVRAVNPAARAERTYDNDVIRQLVDAVHAAGGRVAAHVTTSAVAELVRLGIDSVEHGTALDEKTLVEMAHRGTAWTPTLCAVLGLGADAAPERVRVVAEHRDRFRALLPRAVRMGVPVLTGSDVAGTIPREVALLVECGLEPVDALRAATAVPIQFLRLDEAEMPSVVTYDADPRDDPDVLRHPAAVVIDGVRVG